MSRRGTVYEWVIDLTKYVITEEEYRDTVARRKAKQSSRLDRRLAVIQYRYEGYTYAEISVKVGYSENTISKLIRKFKQNGMEDYLQDRHVRLMSDAEEWAVLRALLRTSNDRSLYAKDVRNALETKLGFKTPTSYVYEVMHRHGVSVKRGG